MKINFVKNTTFNDFIKDLKVALKYSDETLQYMRSALEVYIKSLKVTEREKFVNALPDFIKINKNLIYEEEQTLPVSSLRQLAEMTLNAADDITSKNIYNTDKLLINIIILFSVLQNYMTFDALPILNTELHKQQKNRLIIDLGN